MSRAWLLGIGLLLAACLAPRQPAEPRYFSPGGALPTVEAPAAENPLGAELRLRRVSAVDYLRQRMVWRRGVEVGFHDLLRWTQLPSDYVGTRVARELFERRGLRRATLPSAPSLAVRLLAFDDALEPEHEGVVSLEVLLVDANQVSLLERTIRAHRPIPDDTPEAVARALGEALDQAVDELGAAVEAALERPAR